MSESRAVDFKPPRLLRNPHVQSVLASSALRRFAMRRRTSAMERDAESMLIDAGGGIRLSGVHNRQRVQPEPRGLAVMFHGWEGSVHSTYLLACGSRLLGEGWDVFRLNFRDHGDSHALNPELFHSCRLDEVVGAVAELASRFPPRPLVVLGFSLGGNFALRVALRAPAAGIPLSHALAVCPVMSPTRGLAAIESSPWFYHAYFMLKWRASLKRKQALFPERRYFEPRELRYGMRELTRTLVERHTDLGTLENYLEGYSVAGDRLAALEIPASILTSRDDPVIPVADFERLDLPAHVSLDIAPYGGHCGFLDNARLHSFAEDYVAETLGSLTRAA